MKKAYFSLFVYLMYSASLMGQWVKVPGLPSEYVDFLETAHDRVWIRCGGVQYRSDDQGLHWAPWVLPNATQASKMWITPEEILAISNVSPTDPETIFRSVDNGDTWTPIYTDTLLQFNIYNVFSAGGHLYFVHSPSVGLGGLLLFHSADGGLSWNNLAVEGNGTWDNQLQGANAGGGVLIARKVRQDGIGDAWFYDLKSTDFGQTWTGYGIPNLYSEHRAEVLNNCWVVEKFLNAGATHPLYLSFDSGNNFSQIPGNACHQGYSFTPPDKLFSYSLSCISYWNTSEQTWEALDAPSVVLSRFVQTEKGFRFVSTTTQGLWMVAGPTSDTHTPGALSAPELIISPHPVMGQFQVEWAFELPSESPVIVYDMRGVEVWRAHTDGTSHVLTLDARRWPASGAYLVQVGSHVALVVKG